MSQKNVSNHVRQNHQPKDEIEMRQTSLASGKDLLTEAQATLVTGTPLTTADRVAKVPWARPTDEVLLLIVSAVELSPDGVGEFDGAKMRSVLASLHEQRPVLAQAEMLAEGLRDQILEQKAEVGQACLDAYQVLKGKARTKSGANLRPLVKRIGALLRTRPPGPKAAKQPPPAETAAATEVKS